MGREPRASGGGGSRAKWGCGGRERWVRACDGARLCHLSAGRRVLSPLRGRRGGRFHRIGLDAEDVADEPNEVAMARGRGTVLGGERGAIHKIIPRTRAQPL